MADLKSTAFEQLHIDAGARMVEFGGWNMPVQYDGIIAEHNHTREQVSLFDCSHMGQFRVKGPNAGTELDAILPRCAANQKHGSCRYNFILNESGGVLDDLIVYRLNDDEFYIVVNAGTCEGDAAWFKQHLKTAEFIDESASTSKLDIQGPETMAVMKELGFDTELLPGYFKFIETELDGMPLLLSRTGYTGELGFELYFHSDQSEAVWAKIMGCSHVKPAGLGARDTLRLEMGYPLYGH
ncbi:MAG: glycine cleavage system protein T, partial [Lentisphaeria bacterium]|nr:glycine cleavage system protein T [Lentisphaeria bacterium]